MRTIGNILWMIFGGGILAILWGIAGLLCCCTIIGIPMGVQCFKFASLVFWPFGRNVIFANGTANFLLNILWILIFGWELSIVSFLLGLLWSVTIVGIPLGMQCFKFARLAFMPFGAHII